MTNNHRHIITRQKITRPIITLPNKYWISNTWYLFSFNSFIDFVHVIFCRYDYLTCAYLSVIIFHVIIRRATISPIASQLLLQSHEWMPHFFSLVDNESIVCYFSLVLLCTNSRHSAVSVSKDIKASDKLCVRDLKRDISFHREHRSDGVLHDIVKRD